MCEGVPSSAADDAVRQNEAAGHRRVVLTTLCPSLPVRVRNRCPPVHRRTLPSVLRSPSPCANRQRIWAKRQEEAQARGVQGRNTEASHLEGSEDCVKRQRAMFYPARRVAPHWTPI